MADSALWVAVKLRDELRDAFDPLMRCARTISLEGPAPVAERAEAVRRAASDANSTLWMLSQNEDGAGGRFDEAHRTFRRELERFIEAARMAVQTVR